MIGTRDLFLYENVLQPVSMLQHCILLYSIRRNYIKMIKCYKVTIL